MMCYDMIWCGVSLHNFTSRTLQARASKFKRCNRASHHIVFRTLTASKGLGRLFSGLLFGEAGRILLSACGTWLVAEEHIVRSVVSRNGLAGKSLRHRPDSHLGSPPRARARARRARARASPRRSPRTRGARAERVVVVVASTSICMSTGNDMPLHTFIYATYAQLSSFQVVSACAALAAGIAVHRSRPPRARARARRARARARWSRRRSLSPRARPPPLPKAQSRGASLRRAPNSRSRSGQIRGFGQTLIFEG